MHVEIAIALALFAVVIIPLSIAYYAWLGRHLAPRLVALPIILGISIFALVAALPWLIVATLVWAARR